MRERRTGGKKREEQILRTTKPGKGNERRVLNRVRQSERYKKTDGEQSWSPTTPRDRRDVETVKTAITGGEETEQRGRARAAWLSRCK